MLNKQEMKWAIATGGKFVVATSQKQELPRPLFTAAALQQDPASLRFFAYECPATLDIYRHYRGLIARGCIRLVTDKMKARTREVENVATNTFRDCRSRGQRAIHAEVAATTQRTSQGSCVLFRG